MISCCKKLVFLCSEGRQLQEDSFNRVTESEYVDWKGPSRIIESKSWPYARHPKSRSMHLRA